MRISDWSSDVCSSDLSLQDMRIIKPLRLGILSRPYQYRRQHQLGVAILAMATLEAEPGLVMEADLWKISGEELDEDEVLDLSIPKPCAEFLVSGKAWSHDASEPGRVAVRARVDHLEKSLVVHGDRRWAQGGMSRAGVVQGVPVNWRHTRSEEHTSELQSLMRISYAVFCLKKNKI